MTKACFSKLKFGVLLLLVQVHWDGFKLAPLRYLEAVGWRLIGKKVRARSRFSELNGKSPRAYCLWMARQEPMALRSLPRAMPAAGPMITVFIDHAPDYELVAATTASVLASDPNAHIVDQLPVGFTGWVLPLRAGDRLASEALPAYAESILQHRGSTVIYADDDLLDSAGRRHTPHFKPDWNPELFKYHDYLSGSALLCFRSPLPFIPSKIEDLTDAGLREPDIAPVHLPVVLHHFQGRATPPLPPPVHASPAVAYPHVTVIVPTRDRIELLSTCLDGLAITRYPRFDCVVIDNDSQELQTHKFLKTLPSDRFSVLPFPGRFNFSAMNNVAVQSARGDFLCFLNNDIEIIDPDWLRAMVLPAMSSDCGAVGAKLLYPDRTIQHAGVVTGVGGGAAHAHRFLKEGQEGYFNRAHLPQQVSAVTAACMVVEKRKFLEVGGFDAAHFPVAFNDVDLCLKLNARGWQCIYEPRAILVHHESKSRGDDRSTANRARFAGELAALKRIWGTDLRPDPFHHPQLSRFSDTFVVSI